MLFCNSKSFLFFFSSYKFINISGYFKIGDPQRVCWTLAQCLNVNPILPAKALQLTQLIYLGSTWLEPKSAGNLSKETLHQQSGMTQLWPHGKSGITWESSYIKLHQLRLGLAEITVWRPEITVPEPMGLDVRPWPCDSWEACQSLNILILSFQQLDPQINPHLVFFSYPSWTMLTKTRPGLQPLMAFQFPPQHTSPQCHFHPISKTILKPSPH